MMINNHKDGIKDQPHARLNGNHIDGKKKTSRGPAPTPPPKPPDLMKKGVTSTVPSLPIQPKSEVVGPSGNCNSAQVHLSKKPIKPPKPVGLLNKANHHHHHHVQFNPVSEKSNTINPIGTSENSIEEQLNGNGSDSPHVDEEMVVGGNGVDADENANVPEAEHITNNHVITSEQNSLTVHHDSPGDYPDMMEKVVFDTTMSSTKNGLDSEARNHHELLLPPSSLQDSESSNCYNAGNGVVSRETVTESKPDDSSSPPFIDRGGIISSSVSTMNTTQNQSNDTTSSNNTISSNNTTQSNTTQSNTTQCNVNPMTGLNRRNSNIEKLTSRITTTHIQRSFSSASSRIDFKSKSSSLNPSSGIIKPAKSTASVDSDDSSDEMDVAIELSVGLQRELRQFLEKRRYKVSVRFRFFPFSLASFHLSLSFLSGIRKSS